MASIPGFRLDVTGASGSQGLLSPRNGWKAYVFPRGAFASQDSTGTTLTFDSAAMASRFAVNNWIQVSTATSKIVKVTAVGGNSITVNAAVVVTENDRVFVIGNTQPSVSGGSATYITPNTLVRQRGDDAADLYANSMITTNADGLVQAYATPAVYDVLVQDGNQSNQGYVADLEVGLVEGISVGDWAFFGASVTIHGNLGVTGTLTVGGIATFGSTIVIVGTSGNYSHTGTVKFGNTVTIDGVLGVTSGIFTSRLGGQFSNASTGGAFRFVDGVVFPLTVAGVQAALDECETSGGGTVYIPANAGISVSTTSVDIGTGCVLEGMGPQATGIRATFIATAGASVSAIIKNKHQDGTQQTAEIRNIWINGNSSSGAVVSTACLWFKRQFSGTVIENVRVTNGSSTGVLLEGTSTFAAGPYLVTRLVVGDCANDCIRINEGNRGIWLDGIEADRPGLNHAAIRMTATADSSAQSITCTARNIYMELNKSTHTGIVVNNCANVALDGIDIYNTSGGDITACIVKSGTGTFAGGACGLTVRNLHTAGGNNTQPLISDQVCGVTVTGLSNASVPDLFLNWYSCPVAAGSNGRQSFGQIIGVQYQKQGENIAAANSVTPREGNLFEVTGTTDIQTIEAFPAWKGRAITLVWTNSSPGDLGTGGNVRLAGGVTFSPIQWDAVTLLCTGTTWFEGSPR